MRRYAGKERRETGTDEIRSDCAARSARGVGAFLVSGRGCGTRGLRQGQTRARRVTAPRQGRGAAAASSVDQLEAELQARLLATHRHRREGRTHLAGARRSRSATRVDEGSLCGARDGTCGHGWRGTRMTAGGSRLPRASTEQQLPTQLQGHVTRRRSPRRREQRVELEAAMLAPAKARLRRPSPERQDHPGTGRRAARPARAGGRAPRDARLPREVTGERKWTARAPSGPIAFLSQLLGDSYAALRCVQFYRAAE